jgi:hypothetical protein
VEREGGGERGEGGREGERERERETGSSVSLVTRIQTGLENWGLIPGEVREFSFCHYINTHSEAHPSLYATDTAGSFPASKVATHTYLVQKHSYLHEKAKAHSGLQ